jgi:hypothetical protein
MNAVTEPEPGRTGRAGRESTAKTKIYLRRTGLSTRHSLPVLSSLWSGTERLPEIEAAGPRPGRRRRPSAAAFRLPPPVPSPRPGRLPKKEVRRRPAAGRPPGRRRRRRAAAAGGGRKKNPNIRVWMT